MKKKLELILIIIILLILILVIVKLVLKNNDKSDLEKSYFDVLKENEEEEKKYIKYKVTDMEIQSEEIEKLINNEWYTYKVNFGTKESIFQNYDIYSEEGIKVKTLGRKVFNILLTEKYDKNVINNLKTGMSFSRIKEALGEPTFGNIDTDEMIGYKGKDIYVFFSKNIISIYRVEENTDKTEFLELLEKYKNDNNVFELGNNLTDIWQDYDSYYYNTDYVELTYTLKGIKLKYNYTTQNGITVYNNYQGDIIKGIDPVVLLNNIDEKPKYIYLDLDTDLVYEYEKTRYLESIIPEEGQVDIEETEKNDSYKSSKFNLKIKLNQEDKIEKIEISSKEGDLENSEINGEIISSYKWLNDYNLLYGVRNKGIFVSNCKNRTKEQIIKGNGDFVIEKLENNILTYDGINVILNF